MHDLQSLYFGRFDFSQVRQILYGQVKRLYGNRTNAIIREPMFYYIYYRAQATALQIFLNCLEEVYDGEYAVDAEGTPIPYIQVYDDLRQRAILPAAAMAWLTTDTWRWHHENRHKDASQDLNYGLVLRYPEPIARAAAYAAGLHRPSLEATLQPEELLRINNAALAKAQKLDASFAVGEQVPFEQPNQYPL